jgi:hypothetical protein
MLALACHEDKRDAERPPSLSVRPGSCHGGGNGCSPSRSTSNWFGSLYQREPEEVLGGEIVG